MIKKLLFSSLAALALVFAGCGEKNDPKDPTTVQTGNVTEVTETTAKASGSVGGEYTVTERGVCWSMAPSPTTAGSKKAAAAAGTGSFTVDLTGLTDNTTYYLRAYAISGSDTVYGNEVQFTTSLTAVQPTIATVAAEDIFSMGATIGGKITAAGNQTITERGIVYGATANPTIDDNKKAFEGTDDAFSVILQGLKYSTAYNARAYATTAEGTVYGENVAFETRELVLVMDGSDPERPWSLNFKKNGYSRLDLQAPRDDLQLPQAHTTLYNRLLTLIPEYKTGHTYRQLRINFTTDTQDNPVITCTMYTRDAASANTYDYKHYRIELTSINSFKIVQDPKDSDDFWKSTQASDTDLAAFINMARGSGVMVTRANVDGLVASYKGIDNPALEYYMVQNNYTSNPVDATQFFD